MEKWYTQEVISSTQMASRLVFNIGGCIDESRVLPAAPSRPPDSNGRECYVYVVRGSDIPSIKDLPIDDLAPWNSKNCKSSTRFSEVSTDSHTGQINMRRYTIGDTAHEPPPQSLFACYYCRHPVFLLSKKIYYACKGTREACLPHTFVLFVYEFDAAEKLYTRGYLNSVTSSMPGRLGAGPSALLGAGGGPQRPQRSIASMQLERLYKSRNATASMATLSGGIPIAGDSTGDLDPTSTADQSMRLLDHLLRDEPGMSRASYEDGAELNFDDFLNNKGGNGQQDPTEVDPLDGNVGLRQWASQQRYSQSDHQSFLTPESLLAANNDGALGSGAPQNNWNQQGENGKAVVEMGVWGNDHADAASTSNEQFGSRQPSAALYPQHNPQLEINSSLWSSFTPREQRLLQQQIARGSQKASMSGGRSAHKRKFRSNDSGLPQFNSPHSRLGIEMKRRALQQTTAELATAGLHCSPLNAINPITKSGAKRLMMTSQSASMGKPSPPSPHVPSDYCHMYIAKAALRNFAKSALCSNPDKLMALGDRFGELLSSQEDAVKLPGSAPLPAGQTRIAMGAGGLGGEFLRDMRLGGGHGACLLAGAPSIELEFNVQPRNNAEANSMGMRQESTTGPLWLRFTSLWFRNPTFLNGEGHPVVHPVATLIRAISPSNTPPQHSTVSEDYATMLLELGKAIRELNPPETPEPSEYLAPVCRALLCTEALGCQLGDAVSKCEFLQYPCIRLNCLSDFRETIGKKAWGLAGQATAKSEEDNKGTALATDMETDLFGKVDGEDLTQSTGLLNSLRFEEFVRGLAQVERKWPASFRTWFREKSGWIFERLSLASRLKSGFAPLEKASLPSQLNSQATKLEQHLALSLLGKGVQPSPSSLPSPGRITAVLEEFYHELLLDAAQSIFDGEESTTTSDLKQSGKLQLNRLALTTHDSHLLPAHMTRSSWTAMGKKECLAALELLGLDALPNEERLLIGLIQRGGNEASSVLMNSPHLVGMARSEKLALMARAVEMQVMEVDSSKVAMVVTQPPQPSAAKEDRKEESPQLSEENDNSKIIQMEFVVVDTKNKLSSYVSIANHGNRASQGLTLYCQCQQPHHSDAHHHSKNYLSTQATSLCEHLCAVGLRSMRLARLVSSWQASTHIDSTAAREGEWPPSSVACDIHQCEKRLVSSRNGNIETRSEQDDEVEAKWHIPDRLAQVVDIIHCSNYDERMENEEEITREGDEEEAQPRIDNAPSGNNNEDAFDDMNCRLSSSNTEYLLSLLKE